MKKTTSSKKKDEAPASADPAKAKKKSKPTGNEGAIKTKLNNKDVAGPSSTASKHYKKPFDRHSRSGKTDSNKKIRQSLGDNTKELGEVELEDVEEATEEASTSAAPVQGKSLQEYFAELKVQQSQLDGGRQVRQAASDLADAEKIEKQQAEFVPATVVKKNKVKAVKEKKYLDITANFGDEPKPERKAPFAGRKQKGDRKPKPAVVNDKDFPTL